MKRDAIPLPIIREHAGPYLVRPQSVPPRPNVRTPEPGLPPRVWAIVAGLVIAAGILTVIAFAV